MSLLLFGDKLSAALSSKTLFYGAFSRRIKPRVSEMKLLASKLRIRVMAANQIGMDQSIMVLLPQNSTMLPSEYKTIINPKILKISHETQEVFEESPNFPYFRARVERFREVFVQYDNSKGKEIQENMKGNDALWFQQGMDQLMGNHLLSWIVSRGQVEIKEAHLSQARQNPRFIEAFEKFCEGGRKFNKQRTLAQLNLQDEKENYALGGPTFDLQNQEQYEEMLKILECEMFYTFD